MKQIDELANDPLPRKAIKLEGGDDLYRVRVGDYRVIYGIDHAAKLVTIQPRAPSTRRLPETLGARIYKC